MSAQLLHIQFIHGNIHIIPEEIEGDREAIDLETLKKEFDMSLLCVGKNEEEKRILYKVVFIHPTLLDVVPYRYLLDVLTRVKIHLQREYHPGYEVYLVGVKAIDPVSGLVLYREICTNEQIPLDVKDLACKVLLL